MKRILIVGCGISGSVCAYLLSNKHYQVDIIDKNNHIGGACYDYISQDKTCYIHKYGPHIFHTEDKQIFDFINKFDNFINYHHIIFSQYDNKKYVFPINLNTLSQVFNKRIYSKQEAEKYIHDYYNDNPLNFQQTALNAVGTKLYKMFIENYTIKQWKISPKLLPSSLFNRIKIKYNFNDDCFENEYQGIPEHGYTNLITKMLTSKYINVILNKSFEQFKDKNQYDYIIYTGGFNGLSYKNTQFIHYQDKPNDIAVLNTPQDKQITRITNFNILSGIIDNNETHHYCKQIPCNNNEKNQLYPILTQENIKIYNEKTNQMKKHYPNIMFAGRLGKYKYLDIDDAIKEAIILCQNL